MTQTASTCCYCGVGCGVLIASDGTRITGVQGDPAHPANYGRLCTKGMTLPATAASLTNRALYPEMRLTRDSTRQRVDWDSALDTVAARFADIIRRHGPDAVAFYVSGQLLTEDYYLFNLLAKGLIGTNNIDTNSRLCMSSAVTAYKMAFGADGPPTCYEDLELADCVLFAGSNMAYAHPVLFRRLEAAKATRPATRWIVIDPRRTDTAAMADLHLQIQPGTDVALFNGMLHHLIWEGLVDSDYLAAHTEGFAELKKLVRDYTPKMAAELCGIAEADLITAAEWFGRSPASLSLYCMGLNQSAHGTDKNLALINLHLATGQVGKPGAGPFSLTGQPNAMGGREVGGMATMLAAHRDISNDQHRAEVAAHWGVPAERLSPRPGLPAVAMFDALREGKIKAIWIACTNPAHSMPDLGPVREALQHAEFVVLQEAYTNTDTAAFADVLLPAASWGEKNGTVTNSERRISRVRAAIAAPGEARPDWWIAAEAGRRMEALLHPEQPSLFGFDDAARIFDAHSQLTVGRDLDIGGIDYALLERNGPQQWPLPAGMQVGLARRYVDGMFATINGRARLHVTPYKPVAEPTNARYPFHLLTGRLRDQWHGMSRSGRVPQLFAHTPEPGITMHPTDAERRGLRAGELMRVSSKRGGLVLPLAISDSVPSGSVFAAMHWNGQFLNSGGINEASLGKVDGKSFQPELKHAAVRVERAELPWRALLARRSDDVLALHAAVQPLLAECDYAALSLQGRDVLVLRVACATANADWLARVFDVLDMQPGSDVLEYRDARRNVVKRVAWQGTPARLAGLAFAGDVAGADALLARLLEGEVWQGPRLAAFSNKPAAPRDRVICNCKQVKESQITELAGRGAGLDEIKATLGCGTVCGSCVPELKQLCVNAPQLAAP
ncbi:assimilatory nitrate reductase (NADH) alpha subunit apoprotein [Andreprevotia lacus DSM 23236]|uniref:Assimilatory nitrate reductase (NADH) alpha subunit apoprotein n=1 Tax=Andreprevotia lacus DSM 23236 TaxID=1121001 RepID=A0A1W1XGR6_9NEIS|nr:nitrate reductase [Andreprevotia lacus]SMC22972.1 assimilatory nitrate reductase (NADH) alpha subunit apoprotein [Andreprevotia lacus DSM 23236]